MSYRIAKAFTFAASHKLSGLPEGHKCGRLHGHNYVVEVELSGPLDVNGMVFDYGLLAPFEDHLRQTYDHRDLTEIMVPLNPTAEGLALRLYVDAIDYLELPPNVTVAAVRVHETTRTVAEYRA